MPLDGGAIATIATGQGLISSIATDGQDVFWVSTVGTAPDLASYVRKVNRDGGVVEDLASIPGSQGGNLALDGPFVYWTAEVVTTSSGTSGSGSVSRVPRDGSGPSTVLVGDLVYPAAVYPGDEFVYWTEFAIGSTGQARVMRLKK